MARPITIVRRAAREITEAWEWWQANRPAASEALEQELRRGLALIAQQPNIGPRARNAGLEGVRRVPGYRLYFGRDGDTLVILLAGGTKKRQSRDVEDAKQRWDDYIRRKKIEG